MDIDGITADQPSPRIEYRELANPLVNRPPAWLNVRHEGIQAMITLFAPWDYINQPLSSVDFKGAFIASHEQFVASTLPFRSGALSADEEATFNKELAGVIGSVWLAEATRRLQEDGFQSLLDHFAEASERLSAINQRRIEAINAARPAKLRAEIAQREGKTAATA